MSNKVKIITENKKKFFVGYDNGKIIEKRAVKSSGLTLSTAKMLFNSQASGRRRMSFHKDRVNISDKLKGYDEISRLRAVKFKDKNPVGKAKKLPGHLKYQVIGSGENLRLGQYVVTYHTKYGEISGRSKMFNREGIRDMERMRSDAWENFYKHYHSKTSFPNLRGRLTDTDNGEPEEGKRLFHKLPLQKRNNVLEGVVYYRKIGKRKI